jgi:hypothetical protein
MIPNEVLAAWIVAAITGAAALGGLSLLDDRSTMESSLPVDVAVHDVQLS